MTARKPHRRASGGTAPAVPSAGSPEPEPKRKPEPKQAQAPAPAEPSVLKAKAADDDPRVWGDGPEDRDSWLLEQRPPHWD